MGRTFRVPVQGAHVLQFARAIGDSDPGFEDVDRWTSTGPDALVAPPTFLMAADHFDPAYDRRPRPGVAWIGTPGAESRPVGFHLEQHFAFRRPVRVGDLLTAEERAGRSWQKSGRRVGTMSFTERRTDFHDPDGALVATARWVSATVEHPPAEPAGHPERSPAGEPIGLPADGLDDGAARIGTTWSTTVATELSRTQLVMYAGASGDFHPTHIDQEYATGRGYPGVFAHGMLTMGMSGRAVTERFGHAQVRAFGGRLAAQVWPGDTLSARVAVTASAVEHDERVLDLAVTTVNQHGAVVFDGAASVAVPG